METIQLSEFRRRIIAQGVSDRVHAAFKCPMCKTVQSMMSLRRAGADKKKAEELIGFSCVGRLTGAKGPRKIPDGEPCNWSLGGLFSIHDLEVIDDDGKTHPYFEIATPEEAQTLEAAFSAAEAITDG